MVTKNVYCECIRRKAEKIEKELAAILSANSAAPRNRLGKLHNLSAFQQNYVMNYNSCIIVNATRETHHIHVILNKLLVSMCSSLRSFSHSVKLSVFFVLQYTYFSLLCCYSPSFAVEIQPRKTFKLIHCGLTKEIENMVNRLKPRGSLLAVSNIFLFIFH